MGKRTWTAEQVALLKEHYPSRTFPDLTILLGRPKGSIRWKARELYLHKTYEGDLVWKHPNLSPTERAYLAGIVDGEGTVSFHKYRTSRGTVFYPYVSVGNTSMKIMDWLKTKIPEKGAYVHLSYSKQPKTRKEVRYFVIKGLGFYPLFKTFLDYLVIKKPQMEVLVRYMESRMKKVRGAEISHDELKMVREIHELNQRGVKV